ncbi:MAG TPA: DNA internalization-related competence protein ComEC/Rec2 [Syntrophales bacterium]|nr:DNA internalization-related competence protein ComEC/Rec2 [Syntrophales bacterium]
MQKPLIPIVIALIAGIATGYHRHFPELPLLAGLIIVFSLILAPAIRKGKVRLLFLASFAFFILGILNINLSLYAVPDAKHAIHQTGGGKLTFEGIVNEDPVLSPDGQVIIVNVRSIIGENGSLPAEGLIMLSLPRIEYPFKYGDIIRFKTKLRRPRNFNNPGALDYEKQLRGRGILVQGRISNASDIVLIREGRGNAFKAGIERFRSRLRKIIEENSINPQKEILTALLLGEKKKIPQPVRDSFSRTGTSHILAISGLHVGMIASLSIFMVLAVMKISPYLLLRFNALKVASFIAVIPVLIYAFIAGLGVSVIRSTIMILVFLVAVLIRRERELSNTLALAALIILLINPASLFDISFQLSFMAVASLIFAVPVFSTFLGSGRQEVVAAPLSLTGKIVNSLLLFVFVSITATFGTLPLIAFYFNGFSTFSLPANGVVVPLMGMVVLPIGMLVIITAPFSSALAAFLVKAASFFAAISITAIHFLSSLPGSYLRLSTPSLPEIVCYYLLLVVIVIFIDRKTGKTAPETCRLSSNFLKYAFCALLIFFAVDYFYLTWRDKFRTNLQITAIDVGQGGATLIRLPGGKNMLVDGGGDPGGGTFDVGKYVLAPYLWRERIKQLEAVVLTHPHPDHLQGLLHILENFKVREVWTNGHAADTDLYRNFLKLIEEKGVVHRIMNEKTAPVKISGVTIYILNPDASFQNRRIDDFEETNDASLVLKIAYGKVAFLLTGDISHAAETRLVETGADIKSDVLFVPHHGGRTSSAAPFLNIVRPRIAIVSCGLDNVFKLPHPDVLKRYANLPAKVYRTDLNGAITINTDGKELSVKTFQQQPR